MQWEERYFISLYWTHSINIIVVNHVDVSVSVFLIRKTNIDLVWCRSRTDDNVVFARKTKETFIFHSSKYFIIICLLKFHHIIQFQIFPWLMYATGIIPVLSDTSLIEKYKAKGKNEHKRSSLTLVFENCTLVEEFLIYERISKNWYLSTVPVSISSKVEWHLIIPKLS